MVKIFTLLLLIVPMISYGKNLHIIDENRQTGFAIYRSGTPSTHDFKKFCQLGITEIMVLSGTAKRYEYRRNKACPDKIKIVYNNEQNSKEPLSEHFLKKFDKWVSKAKKEGKKILFRCECGCHRTGRLAAYYQMKYQNLSSNDAIVLMKKWGKFMFFFPYLNKQVKALKDHILDRKCSQRKKYCVTKD
tara:strand:- start:7013 stop:7579 length:567 start_codon:yes stop_codon:yes gene_type:complete